MRLRYWRRAAAGLAVVAGVTAPGVLAASPASASALFGGSAYARTAEWAVLNAFGVAQYDAQEAGFFGQCTIVGQPRVTEIPNDPYRGHTFNASLWVSCEP
jgi:hypothetical protein